MAYDYDGYGSNVFKWFDFLPLRDKIDLKTRIINKDYTLILSPGGAQVKNEPVNTGYCDFQARRCWVNCELATVEADPHRPHIKAHQAGETEEFVTTVYLSAHERAHARWTDYRMDDFVVQRTDGKGPLVNAKGQKAQDRLLHTVWNVLEDVRIERLIERDFKVLRGYLRRGAKSLLRIVPQQAEFKENPITNDPNDIIGWVLRRRLLNRGGLQESCPLGPENQALLTEIEPLLDKAFKAKTSREVVKIAREIIEKLKIKEFNKMMQQIAQALSNMAGQRGANDQAKGRGKGQADDTGTCSGPGDGQPGEGGEEEEEEGSGSNKKKDKGNKKAKGQGDEEGEDESGSSEEDGEKADQDAQSNLKGTGYTDASGTMKKARKTGMAGPYEAIQRSVQQYLNAFSALFHFEKSKPKVDYDRSGSRVDVRRFTRKQEDPFRVDSPPAKKGKIDITLVIDESSSMSGNPEFQSKRVAILFYEALRFRHNVKVVLAPTGKVLAESIDGEMGKAYIAGYGSHTGTCFNEVMAREFELIKNKRNSDTKYVILIADGESGDHDGTSCAALVSKYRRFGIRSLGVGVGLSANGDEFFKGVFGTFFISLKDANELVNQMSRVLRAVAIRTQNAVRSVNI